MKVVKSIFVIEHLEPELYPWCIIEYKSISNIVGKDNLWFTNIKSKEDIDKLNKYGRVFSESVKDLSLEDVCILDPEAGEQLTPKNSTRFKYFIFGGILGDYPPRKRTKEELTPFVKGTPMNIGKEQFSTDNAVYVTNEIINGRKFEEMKFQNELTIQINDVESIILPYYYPLINGKPRISKDLLEFLKNKKDF